MKSKLIACCLVGLAASACQPSDYIDPEDDLTGTSPEAQIFKFDAETSQRFLGANLQVTNALQAEYTIVGAQGARVLVPVQVAGAFPDSAGADADLQGGVGFGTYPNRDRNSSVWTEDSFASNLKAEVVLSQPGDALKFCRSFATTCATVQLTPNGGLVVLTLAARIPDTEIGEIAPGVSASIRGTGANGLTIAVADPTVVARPAAVTAGTPFTFEWSIARGAAEGSIKYSVSVDGTELASGDTAGALAGSIVKEGGVALQFTPAGEVKTEVDYSYTYEGEAPEFDFSNVFGTGVAMSPQPGLAFAPLAVYPTLDPGYELLTLTGEAGAPHSVQAEDGVIGAIAAAPGAQAQVTLYSTAFNGDDFAETPLAGAVDQGIAGGGFYPSPALCYSQVLLAVKAQVAAAAPAGARQKMQAGIAGGLTATDLSLRALTLPVEVYTPLEAADIDTIAADYADNNADVSIATSEAATYTAVLMQPVSQLFVQQIGAILESQGDEPDPALLGFYTVMTTPNGTKETFEAGIELALKDRILVQDESETNPAPTPDTRVPVLAAGCLWGAPPAGEGQPATAPAREQAAAQINALVMGVYGNFISQVFGPTVPASNFSMSMAIGDTESGTAPAVSSIVISAQ